MPQFRNKNICPVCGRKMLEEYEICDICDWQNDSVQLRRPEWEGCANNMSLNEARKAFSEGKKIR